MINRLDSGSKTLAPTKRVGRPRVDQAGDVDERLLAAATELFLEVGFERTSCVAVAVRAQAGKASLYARYPNKTALLSATIRRLLEQDRASAPPISDNLPVRARLVEAGTALLREAVRSRSLALVRLLIAQVPRMPDVADLAIEVGRIADVRRVADAIAGEARHHAGTMERAQTAAEQFVDLTVIPHRYRALVGEEPKALERQMSIRIEAAIETLSQAGLLALLR